MWCAGATKKKREKKRFWSHTTEKESRILLNTLYKHNYKHNIENTFNNAPPVTPPLSPLGFTNYNE